MHDWTEIAAIVNQRRDMNTVAVQEMINVRNRYNAEWVMPLPDVDGEPVLPPIAPALIAEAIDVAAMLASSTWPTMSSPPVDPSKERGVKSREYGDIRTKALHGTWHGSSGRLVVRRGYRHLNGYATTAILTRWDEQKQQPVFEIRDPLGTYPEPKSPEDMSPPRDSGHIFQRSATWLRANIPAARYEWGGPVSHDTPEMWDLVEWIDEEHCVIGLLGPQDLDAQSVDLWTKASGGMMPSLEISRYPNYAEECTMVTASRVTLDKVASQISHMIGSIDLMAQLLSLALIAEEKATFSDMYVVARANETPSIVSNGGQWADGRTGIINLLKNVESVGQMTSQPAQNALSMADRLERNFRVSGTGLVPAAGGETYGSLRTGRGIDSMMGVAVDPRIQEVQEIMQMGMGHCNRLALKLWQHHARDRTVVIETGWSGPSALVEFEPTKHIEHTHNTVAYPIPGMDAQGITVTLGQLLGTGAISMTTMRNMHPWIQDGSFEGRMRDEEDLELAVWESIKQGAASGQMPTIYLAMIQDERKQGSDIFEAVKKADEKLRQQQATAAPPAPEGMVAPPESMPGLAGGPEGTMAPPPGEPPPTIQGPNPDQVNFDDLANALRAS